MFFLLKPLKLRKISSLLRCFLYAPVMLVHQNLSTTSYIYKYFPFTISVAKFLWFQQNTNLDPNNSVSKYTQVRY